MKILVAAATMLLSVSAFASQMPNPLLEKSRTSGFVMPQYRTSYHCRIYADRVEVLTSANGLSAVRSKQISISGDVSKLIESASKGTIIEQPAPTDGPITRYVGIKTIGAGAPDEVVLKSEGSRIESNDSKDAITLINFIEQLCD